MTHVINRRARVYEHLLPVFVSPLFRRYRTQSSCERKGVARRRKRLTELLPEDLHNDELLFEAIDATLSIEFWISLRQDQRLNAVRARRVVERAIQQLTSQDNDRS